MTSEFIADLVRRAVPHRIGALDFTHGNAAVRLRFAVPGAPATVIGSPAVGRLRFGHPMGGAAVAPGDRIARGQAIAFVEAGMLLHAVVAPAGGVLGAAFAEDGAPVGFGDPLFAFMP